MPAGRPRKSASELKLSGTFGQHSSRKDWYTRNDKPLIRKPAPAHYLQRTKVAWNQFMDVKAAQGVLSADDESCIVMMFDCLDRLYRNTDTYNELRKNTNYVRWLKDKENRETIKMIRREISDDNLTFRNWAIRFGLTPTERSKLAVNPDKPQSEMLRLIKEVGEA